MRMLTTAIILSLSILLLAQSETRQEKAVVVDVCDVMTPRVRIQCEGIDCDDPQSIKRIEQMNDHLNRWMAYHALSTLDLNQSMIDEWRREFEAYVQLIECDQRRDRNLLSFFN